MNADIETRADILKTVWTQDFQGVEALRSSVYNVISALAVASFALSSFLITGKAAGIVRVSTDGFLIVFIWVVFLILKRDIRNRRKSLVYRQNLLENLNKDEAQSSMRVFGDSSNITPDMRDYDLFWIPCAASAAILFKMLIVLKI